MKCIFLLFTAICFCVASFSSIDAQQRRSRQRSPQKASLPQEKKKQPSTSSAEDTVVPKSKEDSPLPTIESQSSVASGASSVSTDDLIKRINEAIAPFSLSAVISEQDFRGMKSTIQVGDVSIVTLSQKRPDEYTITVKKATEKGKPKPDNFGAWVKAGAVTFLDDFQGTIGKEVLRVQELTDDPLAQPLGYRIVVSHWKIRRSDTNFKMANGR